MTEDGLTYFFDDFAVQENIAETLARLADLSEPMATIGEMGVASIQQNFDEQGRPDPWEPLAASTIAQRMRHGKWPGQILAITGELKSISYEAEAQKLTLLPANVAWNAIHHFGGKAGKNHSVEIPARPYMLLQDDDVEEAGMILVDYAFEPMNVQGV